MSYNRVRAGSLYRYEPVPLDRFHPPYNIEANDIVRVVNLPSCPKANTMGHAHVEHLGGEFAGLVCTNSLVPLTAEEKSYVVRLQTALSGVTADATLPNKRCAKKVRW